MSYINDALQKVQKETGAPYASLEPLASKPKKKPPVRRGVAIAAFLAVVMLVVGMGFWEWRKSASDLPIQATGIKPFPQAMIDTPRVVPDPPFSPVAEPQLSVQPAEVLKEAASKRQDGNPALQRQAAEEKAPRHTVASADSLYAEGLRMQRAGRLLQAKDLYRRAVKKDPRDVSALNNLGVVYLSLKRYKWAEIRLRDAVKIKPDYAEAHYNLACLYAQKNDTEKCLFHLKQASAINAEAKQWALRDRDFKNIAGLPEFQAVVQKRD